MKAITTKKIGGAMCMTIPAGTEFEITHIGEHYSSCKRLGITSIWNDEYKLLPRRPKAPNDPVISLQYSI